MLKKERKGQRGPIEGKRLRTSSGHLLKNFSFLNCDQHSFLPFSWGKGERRKENVDQLRENVFQKKKVTAGGIIFFLLSMGSSRAWTIDKKGKSIHTAVDRELIFSSFALLSPIHFLSKKEEKEGNKCKRKNILCLFLLPEGHFFGFLYFSYKFGLQVPCKRRGQTY